MSALLSCGTKYFFKIGQISFLFHEGFIVIKKISSSWVGLVSNKTTKNIF